MINRLKQQYIGRKVQWILRGQYIFPESKTCTNVLAYFASNPIKYYIWVSDVNTAIPIEEIEIINENNS